MLELKQIESFFPEHIRPFKRNMLREYLQYKILEVVFISEFGKNLVFMGGTAVHIAHALPRFSEDLDFDNLGLDKKNFNNLAALIERKLRLQGYTVEIKTSFENAYRIYIKIADILYENKISLHREEKMLIQVDAEPQNFPYTADKIILNKFDVFTQINLVPLDILLSQKLYAIFMRKRAMGRDFFDAIFLFGRAKPNFTYLKAKINIDNMPDLKEKLIKHCCSLDLKILSEDVRQFLFIPDDAKKIELFREYISSLTNP
ncbi:MAG: nucleotidyl transferase AbiEii/AbiGii toxin family protein [Candidatus Omnitrophica bacterium]|nr:nucleotidyl transferase AbiEii/AbiGii toxin family protein [Candidatus Omnitrophota bacterium]